MNETEFLNQVRANQAIIYKLAGLYANDAEEKKDMYQGSIAKCLERLAILQRKCEVQHLAVPHLFKYHLHFKKNKRHIDYKDSLELLSPAVENSGIQKEEAQRLQQAIRLLSETGRAIISMHLDGFENSEIAGVLCISKNHVAVKLHRIKEQLSNLLKKSS